MTTTDPGAPAPAVVDGPPSGERRAPVVVMTDVARAAGVSQKTVSRVLNGSAHVRPEVRERVRRAVDELGYRRNAAARALVRGRTHVIGVVGLRSALYGVSQHVMGLERAAQASGYGVVVVSTATGEADEVLRGVERALELGAEGVVLVEPYFDTRALRGPLAGTPVVAAARSAHEGQRAWTVDADQVGGVEEAVEHLVDLGHRCIGHLAGPTTWRSALVRERTWRAAVEARGLAVVEPVRGDWSARSGYEATCELLAREPRGRVTALVAANDHMAVGAMRALAEAGLSVPDDVSLVGFDDVPEAAYLPVPLTTVRQDLALVGERAVASLVELVEGHGRADAGDEPRLDVVPVELRVRSSTGPAPRAAGGGRPPT
ncbi:substrate-binding domain-containing protein [Pseudokineococcus marinus]|nr:substrate-binding domain-containing protein [Pseudokineococcus marinus]